MNYGYNPKKLEEYLKQLHTWCKALQQSQNGIETRFLRAGETWHDNVYYMAGSNLLTVSSEVKVLYGALATGVANAIKFSNAMNRTQEYDNVALHLEDIPAFASKILEGDLKSMHGEEKDNVINLEDMKDFAGELERYAKETEEMLAKIKQTHRAIGDDGVWVSPQYNQMTEIIDDLNRRMAGSIDKLRFSQALVLLKWKELSDILKYQI